MKICCPKCKSRSLCVVDLKTKLRCGCLSCGLDFWLSKKHITFDEATGKENDI